MAKSQCDRAKRLVARLINQYSNHPTFGPGLWDQADLDQWYLGCHSLCGAITDCAKGQDNENELTADRDTLQALLAQPPSESQQRQINGALQTIRDSLPQ